MNFISILKINYHLSEKIGGIFLCILLNFIEFSNIINICTGTEIEDITVYIIYRFTRINQTKFPISKHRLVDAFLLMKIMQTKII